MLHRRTVTLLRAIVINELPFVQATRRYLGDLIVACFHDQPESLAYAERLSTAAAELLENAFKYSPPSTGLIVRLSKSANELLLQVGNALREEGRSVLQSIRREIGSVWAEHDAREVFSKESHGLSCRSQGQGDAGLRENQDGNRRTAEGPPRFPGPT